MKKYFPSKNVKKETKSNVSNIVKYHLDDKGRRVFDFKDQDELKMIEINKKEHQKLRNEYKLKNLNSETSKFKCENCNLVFTDSDSYKDHLNGKLHNMIIGNTLNVKNASLEKVKQKLLNKKRERDLLKHKDKKNTNI